MEKVEEGEREEVSTKSEGEREEMSTKSEETEKAENKVEQIEKEDIPNKDKENQDKEPEYTPTENCAQLKSCDPVTPVTAPQEVPNLDSLDLPVVVRSFIDN